MKQFRFKKGHHYPTNWFWVMLRAIVPLFNVSMFSIEFRFDKSCANELADPYRRLQWNKLGGIAQYGFKHRNSVRIAWRALDSDQIELGLYEYYKGIRHAKYLTTVNVDTDYTMLVDIEDGSISITGASDDVKMSYHNTIWFDNRIQRKTCFSIGCRSYPYYGGITPAEVDCSLKMRLTT